MTIRAVEEAIRHARKVIAEWGPPIDYWREDQTRYAIIDPIIRALGWETSDPSQCYPEYPRHHSTYGWGRADYALLSEAPLHEIGNANVAPAIIIESKAVGRDLDDSLDQLQHYVESDPKMTMGVAVLTNGVEWRLYDVKGRGSLAGKFIETVDIIDGNQREAARILNDWLNRSRWR